MKDEYIVYNYSGSKVVVKTKDFNYLFDSGSREEPFGISLSVSEIISINMNCPSVFKNGLLFFDEQDEEYLYGEIRIKDWKNILKDWEIEEILVNPTYEGYKKLLDIDNIHYFNRVVGIMTSLKNAFIDVPTKSQVLVTARADELDGYNQKVKRQTEIKLDKIISETETDRENKKLIDENESLKSEIEEMKKMLNELKKATTKSATTKTTKTTKATTTKTTNTK